MIKTKKINLTQGQTTIVNACDYNLLSKYKWYAAYNPNTRSYRVFSTVGGKTISMSRLILNAKTGEVVDHINHDTLDNRRCNLRICSFAENRMNIKKHTLRWGYKGITPADNGKWLAQAKKNREYVYIGTFDRKIDAVRAYNQKALELFGEYANINNLKAGELYKL